MTSGPAEEPVQVGSFQQSVQSICSSKEKRDLTNFVAPSLLHSVALAAGPGEDLLALVCRHSGDSDARPLRSKV